MTSHREVWVDVGAHKGNSSLPHAAADPFLSVYAFEPNLRLAARLMGLYRNYHVLPMAVAETNGSSPFHLNALDAASSLLELDPAGVKRWRGGDELYEIETTVVPTIRLDTFMETFGLTTIDFLKVDAQGTDLAVVRSAGDRLKDIAKVMVEVAVTPFELYRGAGTKEETIGFLSASGFELTHSESQSHDQEQNLTFVRRRQ